MFTNIPQNLVIDIIKTILLSQEFDTVTINDIIYLVELIFEQNYFTHSNSFYKQTFGPTCTAFAQLACAAA
jgi:hypothetical protein